MEEISKILISELLSNISELNQTRVNNHTGNNSSSVISVQPTSNSGHASFLSAKTLIAIIILLIYTISNSIFEKLHFHYIHESGVCMILGFLVGLISMLVNPLESFTNSLQFDDEIFFNFILPPIIFAAGYNLKKKSFFKYFFYIFIFGVLGTIITFSVVAPLTYLTNQWNFYGLTFYKVPIIFSLKEILLFSSVIVATDTVAALTFVKESNEPKLFSILFGEGVLNDAVCIVLYRIIKMFNFQNKNEEFTGYTFAAMLGSFLMLFLISTFLGIIGGLTCSIFLKKLKYFRINRTQENSIIIFFAFTTYSCTELLGYSPIISLLFCGIFMSHYAFYNLSFQAREESSIVSKIMSNIAEGFVFTYLGLTSVSITAHSISVGFIFWILIFVLLGRFIAIYGLSFFLRLIRCPNFEMKKIDKGIMCFAGSIRGAIAFGLAISIESNSIDNR